MRMKYVTGTCMATVLAASLLTAGAGEAEDILKKTGITGGLVVHVGCGDGKLAAELGSREGFVVHGLDTSENDLTEARELVKGLDLYGNKVSISSFEGKDLPYVDNLVKLMILEEGMNPARDEIMRVLSPQGVAYIKKGGKSETIVKPRPSEMDAWSHYMYNASGNPVSRDTLVASPEHLQWVGSPKWSRHHDHMASMHAMVSTGNRIFYIIDEGSTASIVLPSKWKLIARDAFSGVVLWEKPIPRWWTRFQSLKSGIAQLPRRLVATPEHVYVTLGLHAPVSKLDAVTGKTLATYSGTENTWEIIHTDGLIYAVSGSPRAEEEKHESSLYPQRAPGNPINTRWKGWERKLFAVDTSSGKTAWQLESKILPGTLTADTGAVYFHNSESIVALNKKDGKELWASEPVAAIDLKKGIPTGYMPRLAIQHGVIVFAGGHGYDQHMKGKTLTMVALSAKDGKVLWKAPHYTSGYQSPEDLFIANKVVLSPFTTWLKGNDPKNNHVVGVDIMTGKQVLDSNPDVNDPVWFIHARCHPSRATTDYLLLSKEGIELIDLKTGRWKINHWIRGACLYGIMPANGLIYAPMHSCACSADMKLNGMNAVAAAKARKTTVDITKHLLTKGPAYGKLRSEKSAGTEDWPTYRNDASRSGKASCSVKPEAKTAWKIELGGKLSAPVVAGGRLYIAAVDRHTLHALDSNTGKKLWSFTTDGRIDSPPSVHNGVVLFGSRDGCVYCLRAADGELVWRFRAVAEDRRLMAWEQVESVWPVHGNILIRNGEAWFVAGRSLFLDGGLQMFRLNPETGEIISKAHFDGKADDRRLLSGSEEKRLAGLSDILATDGENIFMRSGVFKLEGDQIKRKLLPARQVGRYGGNAKFTQSDIVGESKVHLYSAYGYLDDSWFHRAYWVYNDLTSHRHGYANTGRSKPAGRILVADEENIYGFGREKKYFNWTSPMEYRLFAEPKKAKPRPKDAKNRRGKGSKTLWEQKLPILARGLVLAGDTLFAAGPPDVLDETKPGIRNDTPEILKAKQEQDAALMGLLGGTLLAVSRTDGAVKVEHDLDAPPVFDGLIAANGNLYMALENGTVECWK